MTTELDHLRNFRTQDAVGDDRAREAARAALSAHIDASRYPQRARRPRRRWLDAAPVLAAMLIAVAVVGGALVLLGHRGHGPVSGSRPPGGGIGAIIAHTPQRQLHRELAYIAAATRSVQTSKACQLQQPSGATYIQGSPGPDLLSILGVLRRPATPADRLNPKAVAGTPDIYRDYVRRAFSARGASYYIVPVRFDRAATLPSDRCFALQTTALNRYLPGIPASLRQPTRELQAALITYFRTIAAQAPATICLVNVAGNDTGSLCGIAPKGIEEGLATDIPGTNLDTFTGVVPDGVATVTLIFPPPAHAVTTRVEGNVYAVHASIHVSIPSRSRLSPTVIWRSPEGRVLKRISPSNPATRARLCRQHPVACLLIQVATVAPSEASRNELALSEQT